MHKKERNEFVKLSNEELASLLCSGLEKVTHAAIISSVLISADTDLGTESDAEKIKISFQEESICLLGTNILVF